MVPLSNPLHPIYYPQSLEELEKLRLLHRKMIRPQMLALHAMIPGILHMSPSRSVMSVQQASQHLVWAHMEKPVVLTGVEYEFGKYAFADRMPEDGQIISVIPRYPRGTNIRDNPEILVVYITKDQRIDYFSIGRYQKFHPMFGYMKKFNEKNMNLLTEGRYIPKGTIFAGSPGVADDGCYMMGLNANIMFVDDEGLAEDGMIARQSFVEEKLVVDIFDEIEISFGSQDFLINLLGSGKEVKLFPDIGETIRHDGLVAVKRKFDTMNSPVMMSEEALRMPNGIGDEFIYSIPTPLNQEENSTLAYRTPGEVIDIVAIRNPRAKRSLPPSLSAQLERYELANQNFNNALIKVENKLTANIQRRNPEGMLPTSPRYQILMKMARGLTNQGANRFQGPIEFQQHRARMDEWTVRLTIRHRRTAVKGDKFTGLMGDKGVLVDIRPDGDFPPGVDMMAASSSTMGRTNLNRYFVPRTATAAVDLTKEIREKLNIPTGKKITLEEIELLDDGVFSSIMERLLKFYAITSPHLYYTYTKVSNTRKALSEHLMNCLNEVIHPLQPCDNPINDIDSIIHLEKEGYLKPYQRQTYRNSSGKIETSETPLPVLSTYVMYLEKIAIDGSAASFGKEQHHGLLASLTKAERYQYNFRNVSTRNIGQHESEILNHDSRSPALIAELMDRANNPEVMRHQAFELLTNPKPTSIYQLVPRDKFPLNNMRPRQLLLHFYQTQGMDLAYMRGEDAAKLPIYEETINNG